MAIRNRFLAVLAAGLGLTGALVVGTTPASAHLFRAYVVTGGTIRGFVEARADHLSFAACDTNADGIGVYGRFQLRNGTIIDISDSNGSANGCGVGNTSSSNPLVRMEAVSRNGGSSGWVDA